MANASLSACLAEIKANPGKFYVYVLSRPCGTPFYVGMGQAERIGDHATDARSARRSRRLSIIRKIWRSGNDVSYAVHSFHLQCVDAWSVEVGLIAKLGRLDLGTGPLANATKGGEGGKFSQETLRRRRLSQLSSEKWAEGRRVTAAKHVGRPLSAEHKAAISKAHQESPKAIAARAVLHDKRRGMSFGEDFRRKISASSTGRRHSESAKRKLSDALKAATGSAEHRALVSARTKALWADPAFRRKMLDARASGKSARQK